MSSPQNKIQVLSTAEPASDQIDAIEAAQLVGYNPNETEKLVDDEYKLVQENEGGDTRPRYEHPMIRFASVALPLGALGGGALGIWFLVFAPKNNSEAPPITSATPTPNLVPNAEGRLKSQLAFQDQQTSLEKPKSVRQTKPKIAPAKPSAKRVEQPTQPIPVRRTVTAEPEPPRLIRSVVAPTLTASQPIVQPKPVASPKAPDPYAQWDTLAKLGQQQAQLLEAAQARNQIPTASASTIPTVQVSIEPQSPEIIRASNQMVSNPVPTSEPNALVPEPVTPAISSPSQIQKPEYSPSVSPNHPLQVAIGTTTPAKVIVPAIATANNRERSLVEITQDVRAIDGRIALPKGTLIATEITKVDLQTHLVHQTPVAIVYRNRLVRSDDANNRATTNAAFYRSRCYGTSWACGITRKVRRD